MSIAIEQAAKAGRVTDVVILDWSREISRQRSIALASLNNATHDSRMARDASRVIDLNDAMLDLIGRYAEIWNPNKLTTEPGTPPPVTTIAADTPKQIAADKPAQEYEP